MTGRKIEVLLDDARPGQERLRCFAGPVSIVQAHEPGDVGPALAALETARQSGRHVAGYFSYEMGYVLEPRLRALLPARREMPLLWFGIFDRFEELRGDAANDALAARAGGRCYAGPLAHEWNERDYASRFARVHDLIEAGDIYQANLSFRSRFAAAGDPVALYLKLRESSRAAHGAFIDDGARHILSLSPELFFEIAGDGGITARPMKGTGPRGRTPIDDHAARMRLKASVKDRAENLMIVDLLRNDLGRIAETGSVSVSDLYAVESYPTVHQMVSTVRAKLRSGVTVAEIVHALFPCGSVTGTPKIRAMEIIREAEESPRGVYCGAIGHFAPDGSAGFNVAIRTLTLRGGRGELGIGGAVVYDSRASAEHEECLLKARYYETMRHPLELIETLRHAPDSGFCRLDLHFARLSGSAAAFGIPFRREDALRAMGEAVRGKEQDLRVRLALREDGSFNCTAAALPAPSPLWRYAISPVVTQSGDLLLRHKTSWREVYDGALAQARDCDEVLFTNEHGRLTEGSRTSIFVRRNGRLLTPPLSDGLLPGCLRGELIVQGACEETHLYPHDLETADEVLLGNSLRGLVKAVRAAPVASRAS